MTRVKICGIREPADALVAAAAGADFVGLVFVPGRRRCLEPGAAQGIVKGLRASGGPVPKVVGLFADQPLEEVNRIIRACGLDLAQLCGGEPLEYCESVQCRVIKVVHVDATVPGEAAVAALAGRVRSYRDAGHLVTLDRLVAGLQGGTGASFDWEVAASLSQRGLSFLLAGGLSPANVAQAVATVRPWGVDVSTGVETDGAKDHEKIRAFIENTRQPSALSDQPSASDPTLIADS
ncbi:MAG: phosphoribosylanthranilate isomerase [Dehalococcoidia bacterium]|jgi:phosphoribosylanthranilate isomerase|nr:phosphoribosylanthranilate isomerase [Dehalococcoidia bacterium]